jgi:hypothetical protein
MTRDVDQRLLDTLACEIELRPSGAPGIESIASAVTNTRRHGEGSLTVSFDPRVSQDLEAFVAAEQQCCASIGWSLDVHPDAARLTITASPEQADLLQQLFGGG